VAAYVYCARPLAAGSVESCRSIVVCAAADTDDRVPLALAFPLDASERPVSNVDASSDQNTATGRNGSGPGVALHASSGCCTYTKGPGKVEGGRLEPARSGRTRTAAMYPVSGHLTGYAIKL